MLKMLKAHEILIEEIMGTVKEERKPNYEEVRKATSEIVNAMTKLENFREHLKLFEKNLQMEIEWIFEQFPHFIGEKYSPIKNYEILNELNIVMDCLNNSIQVRKELAQEDREETKALFKRLKTRELKEKYNG